MSAVEFTLLEADLLCEMTRDARLIRVAITCGYAQLSKNLGALK